jgi:preprotein translocase subunit YajC
MLYALLFANDDAAPKEGLGFLSSLGPLGPLLLLLPVFYFLIIRPAQVQNRKMKESLATLKKNDEVVTSGGIIGIVQSIKDGADEVTLKVDDNARIRVLKSSIVRIVPKEAPKV